MNVTIVQLKEYSKHCLSRLNFFKEEEKLKAVPEQRENILDNLKYYNKEVLRMNKKILNYPL